MVRSGVTKKLKKYNLNKKIHDHKALENECWFIDDTIDIHYLNEFKIAEKNLRIKECLKNYNL